jgi:hypothetical protein
MAGDMPPDFGEGSTTHPPTAGQWTPTHPTQPAARVRTWPAIALGAIATLVAVAALIVALRNSTPTPATTRMSTYTAAETATAQRQLCDTYKLAAQAVATDTGGGDKALARISTTNGALILDMAADNPALDASHRDAARALAIAYGTLTAKGTYGISSDAEYQAAMDDIIAKDAVMKKVCGGG